MKPPFKYKKIDNVYRGMGIHYRIADAEDDAVAFTYVWEDAAEIVARLNACVPRTPPDPIKSRIAHNKRKIVEFILQVARLNVFGGYKEDPNTINGDRPPGLIIPSHGDVEWHRQRFIEEALQRGREILYDAVAGVEDVGNPEE